MIRKEQIEQLRDSDKVWDVLVIGGGASGLGVALDSISRGYSTLLVEKHDFGKGTSSRSTKLIHGGVRYLAQGNIRLVREALKERAYFLDKASHLSRLQPFIIPFYSYFQGLYYYTGLKIYDFLSGRKSIGDTSWLSSDETLEKVPNLIKEGLKGGIQYFDGQFDDGRMCIDLVRTIINHGGHCVNYCECSEFIKEDGQIVGAKITDCESGASYQIKAKNVVNATGVFANKLVKKDDPQARELVTPSRGSHLVFDAAILGGDHAVMIPKTSDGRVLFIIPWNKKVILGTTDIKTDIPLLVPEIEEEEINFMIDNAGNYLSTPPTINDVKAVYSGLRPLAAPKRENAKTKEISRGHKVIFTNSGLCNIIGGKWTTFRKMGEDVINALIVKGKLKNLPSTSLSQDIQQPGYALPPLEDPTSREEMYNIIRNEMVVKAEDYLARRTRITFLDASYAELILSQVVEAIADVNNFSSDWKTAEMQKTALLITKYKPPFVPQYQ